MASTLHAIDMFAGFNGRIHTAPLLCFAGGGPAALVLVRHVLPQEGPKALQGMRAGAAARQVAAAQALCGLAEACGRSGAQARDWRCSGEMRHQGQAAALPLCMAAGRTATGAPCLLAAASLSSLCAFADQPAMSRHLETACGSEQYILVLVGVIWCYLLMRVRGQVLHRGDRHCL